MHWGKKILISSRPLDQIKWNFHRTIEKSLQILLIKFIHFHSKSENFKLFSSECPLQFLLGHTVVAMDTELWQLVVRENALLRVVRWKKKAPERTLQPKVYFSPYPGSWGQFSVICWLISMNFWCPNFAWLSLYKKKGSREATSGALRIAF